MSTKVNYSNFLKPDFLILILSVFGLCFAFFVEYIMQLAPCPLCVYQRFPYLVLIMLSIISLINERTDYTKYYVLIILSSILLAGYHTGVERGIFELSSMCKPLVSISSNTPIEEFTKMLYSEPIATCSKPALVILNLSMTEWNLILNITLLVYFATFQKIKI